MPDNSSGRNAESSSHPRTPGVVMLAKDIRIFLGRISGAVRKDYGVRRLVAVLPSNKKRWRDRTP